MYFQYKNTKIFYKVVGSGTPILFLHGWQSSSDSFSLLKEQLKYNFKLVFIDFPPFGKSKNINQVWDVNTYSDATYNLIKQLDLQNFIILAHSFGGRVAINLCTCYNCNVQKLILTGSAGLKPRNAFLRWLKVKKYKLLKRFSKNLQKYGSNDYKVLSSTMKQSFVKIVNFHQDNLAKQIKVPTLVIFGQNDKETPVYMAKKFTKLIKNCKLEILKNTGHFCFLQAPEQFYDLVIHFILN